MAIVANVMLVAVNVVGDEPAVKASVKQRPDPETFPNRRTFTEVVGAGGKSFHVVIYWNNLQSVPGSHEIVARIRRYGKEGLSKNGIDHWFESGNRRDLVGVEMNPRGAAIATLILRFRSHGGGEVPGREGDEVKCTVTEGGLKGLPTDSNRVLKIDGVQPVDLGNAGQGKK